MFHYWYILSTISWPPFNPFQENTVEINMSDFSTLQKVNESNKSRLWRHGLEALKPKWKFVMQIHESISFLFCGYSPGQWFERSWKRRNWIRGNLWGKISIAFPNIPSKFCCFIFLFLYPPRVDKGNLGLTGKWASVLHVKMRFRGHRPSSNHANGTATLAVSRITVN